MKFIAWQAGAAALPTTQRVTISSKPAQHHWGAFLALAGIVLVALNLRAAVVSVSPIFDRIGQNFPISPIQQGFIGTLPLLCFALFGTIAPRLTPRFGLEKSLFIATAIVGIGEVIGFSSIVCLGGMGLGNVLLPPAIKHYFPHRIGALTGLYLVLTTVSASLPSLVAVPMTDALGWRFSVGIWSVLGFAAVVPWLRLIQHHNAADHAHRAAQYPAWRWPTTWAITVLFSIGALDMFALIAWLPEIVKTTAGVSAATAGAMLSTYNFVGLPHSLLAPLILTNVKQPYWVVAFATLCICTGTLGLAYAPRFDWFSIIPAGLGAIFIPIGLTLINLRSRTEEGTTALSPSFPCRTCRSGIDRLCRRWWACAHGAGPRPAGCP